MKTRVGMWYATGPSDEEFTANNPRWNVHTVVSEQSGFRKHVTVENAAGQRFPVAVSLIDDIAERQAHTQPGDGMRETERSWHITDNRSFCASCVVLAGKFLGVTIAR